MHARRLEFSPFSDHAIQVWLGLVSLCLSLIALFFNASLQVVFHSFIAMCNLMNCKML